LFVCVLLEFTGHAESVQINFRVNSTNFLYKNGSEWEVFGKFAGVNLGITNPGYLPGNVMLSGPDYINRFKILEKMGIKVIRVYSILHPDFYSVLLEWNKKHEHKIYVLHGTAFPEVEFEGNNGEGNDVYSNNITEIMKNIINNTVSAVYGQGSVVYKYIRGIEPVTGNYNSNIAQYLIGWVIGGEVWPYSINKTINNNMMRPRYQGIHITTHTNAHVFESWIAEIMDYVAIVSEGYGYGAPISHTNWATTDGISNPAEPRFPDSIEDMAELDMTNIVVNDWIPGTFYNQHIYPYYPEFIKNVIYEGVDPYYTYIDRIRQKYHNKPFIVTEVGISTSIGVASYDNYLNRSHGQVDEVEQCIMLKDIIINLVSKHDIYGVMVFQLMDEWFKKTWNTRKFEPSNRNYWYNPLSAEQSFGIFSVKPMFVHKSESYYPDKYIKHINISHDEMSFKIHIEHDNLIYGKIYIGIDSMRSGSNSISNLGITKQFDYMIDHILVIDIETGKIDFYQLGIHNEFIRHYGEWLSNIDDYVLVNNINDILNPSNGLFYKFSQLVTIPSYMWDGIIMKPYHYVQFVLDFLNKDDKHNLGLFSRSGSTFDIDIPYGLIGYTNPAYHEKYILTGSGNMFNINNIIDNVPVNLEISYNLGEVEFIESKTWISYEWNNWEIPLSYRVKAKSGINHLCEAFHNVNGYLFVPLSQESIDSMGWEYRVPLNYGIDYNIVNNYNIHRWIVRGCLAFMALCFFCASIGKFIVNYIGYCYSCRDNGSEEGSSKKLRLISLILFGLIAMIYFVEVEESDTEVTSLYILVIFLIGWDYMSVMVCMICVQWNINIQYDDNFECNQDEHAFIITCHNSSDVIRGTIRSLLTQVKPGSIYVADNGSTPEEQCMTWKICREETVVYYDNIENTMEIATNIHYGHLDEGNKTLAQYGSVISIDKMIKYVTCIDDDTRLDESWTLAKVLRYFKDPDVAVLAYPLKVYKPKYEIELFQTIEYAIVGLVKIFHSMMRSTVFNSGAFGTYRVDILHDAYQYHNTDFNGDDLQICLIIHRLYGCEYINGGGRVHDRNYRIATAYDIIISTIVPKCWVHSSSVLGCLKTRCGCANPDLFKQRVKGWSVSQHRFIFRVLRVIVDCKGLNGLWVRVVMFYELLLVLSEYFNIIMIIILVRVLGIWILEAIIIGMALNILTLIIFNWVMLRPNKMKVSMEVLVTQPIIYKFFIILIYKQLGLWYNLLVYSVVHRSGRVIMDRMKDVDFRNMLAGMYNDRECNVINSGASSEMSVYNGNNSNYSEYNYDFPIVVDSMQE